MPEPKPNPAVVIRDLQSLEDLRQVETLEQEVWGLSDRDVLPLTMTVAAKEAGSIWLGAFDGNQLVGFGFGFLGMEHGQAMVHSHMLAVRNEYRDLVFGYRLKVVQPEP